MKALVSFVSGFLFAIGLGVSGMTSPAKVRGFLDITSSLWDPSLMFVMVGAIGIHVVFVRLALKRQRPLFGQRFVFHDEQAITPSLLAGAALFGVGWGLAGYCPGPAIVSATAVGSALLFTVSMLAAMATLRYKLK